jgi:SlyX protein
MSDEDAPARIARLEERLAWFERHVTAQDRAMLELSDVVEKLRRELLVLRERGATAAGGGVSGNLPAEERPPHW